MYYRHFNVRPITSHTMAAAALAVMCCLLATPAFSATPILEGGAYHSVALRGDGTLWVWGATNYDQDGNGVSDIAYEPIQVGLDTDWAFTAAGQGHSIAVKEDGSLYGWGDNFYGQLGDGTTARKILPTRIGTDVDWSFVAAGDIHSAAIKTDGTLWAWGYNIYGQLGDGTTIDRHTPVQVGTDTDWVAVKAGFIHTVGLKSNGTLWAWGKHWYLHEDGDGLPYDSHSPVQIGTEADWATIATGWQHSLAIKSNGTLWAWGQNPNGQLGDGTTTDRVDLIQVGTENTWASITGGGYHSAATKSDGTLWVWGASYYDRDGDGIPDATYEPAQVGSETAWVTVGSGRSHTLALKADGTIWGWGQSSSGQIGDGSTPLKLIPVQEAQGDLDWESIAAGGLHSLALKLDKTLYGWGYDNYGELGNGYPLYGRPTPYPSGADTDWALVSGGRYHSAGLKENGTLWTWGYNIYGQLGNGSKTQSAVPVQVGTDTTWVDVSAGERHTAAVKNDGTLWAWGEHRYDADGDGTVDTSLVPIQVGLDTDWVAVESGNYHTIAKKSNGSLWAWGANSSYGQIGDGTNIDRMSPVLVPVEPGLWWTQFAASYSHSVAVRSDGTLWGWGSNICGQLGDGTTILRRSPVQAGLENDWVAVAAGGFTSSGHTAALKADGRLMTYGCNGYGQLGDGTTTNHGLPVQVGTESNWTAVSAGEYHMTALKSDGSHWAWGNGQFGQLGDGTWDKKLVPGQASNLNLDVVPPTAWAAPASGVYTGQVTVVLAAYDETDPAPTLRFTTDGSAPNGTSPVYTSPLTFSAFTTLRFFAADSAGNIGTAVQEDYVINNPPAPAAPYIEVRRNKTGTSQVDHGDPDTGDSHTYLVTQQPLHGTTSVNGSGLVTYTPDKNYTGTDALTVEVSDQLGASGSVVIYVYVDVAPAAEICDDGLDNDGDGLVDCDDAADCGNDPLCCVPSSPDEIGLCTDGLDNDCDGAIDGADDDCPVTCDGYGNRTDCNNDPGCLWQGNPNNGTCIPSQCSDNDNDGYGDPGHDSCANGPELDCNDADPAVNPGAAEGPIGHATCSDGADNDCDGATDLSDSGCQEAVSCDTLLDKTSCNAELTCRWDNKGKVCVNQ